MNADIKKITISPQNKIKIYGKYSNKDIPLVEFSISDLVQFFPLIKNRDINQEIEIVIE